MPVPHHSSFLQAMPFLPPNQQHQSNKGQITKTADIFSTVTAGSLGVIPGQTTSHKEKLCGQPFAGWLPSSHPNQ